MQNTSGGFTLIELLVVVIIIVALAGMVVPKVIPVSDDAKEGITKGSMASVELGLDLFRLHVGRYPTTDEGVDILMEKSSSLKGHKGPYLSKRPNDAWKKKFHYKYPATKSALSEYDLWSSGIDMQSGNEDDIWPEEGGEQ